MSDLSRRDLLRWGAALGAGVVGAPLLDTIGGLTGATHAAGGLGTGMAVNSLSTLAPFKPNLPVGPVPNLPKRIAWANSSNAQFFLELGSSIQIAAKNRGWDYVTAIANNDSATNINQIDSFMQVGIGALCIQPIDAAAQAIVMKRALQQGIAVMTLVTPPSVVQAVADQYSVGHAQGLAAAKWITKNLGGKAKVVMFNHQSIQVLIPRYQGVMQGVKSAGPGVQIVANIEPPGLTVQSAEQVMATLIQAHPDVNVILGGDTDSLGALAAYRSANKDVSHMYFSGIDGNADALAEIVKGGPYKASFAFAYNLMGYAWGEFAADWGEGKSIPQVMVFTPIQLDSKVAIDTFNKAMSTGSISKSFQATSTYMKLLGNISYGTIGRYITTSPYK